jgi:FixJ family two-component response regulator
MQSNATGCISTTEEAMGRSPMSEPRPTVFVVDDDVSVRESLETLIQVAGWDARVFDSAEAFLACPPASGPNCLVLDVSLPDLNGLDLQASVAGDRAEMPIIFITGHGDVRMSVQAMKAGAAEFLTKPFGEEELLGAIEAALRRSRERVAEQTALRALRERYDSLSRREREVMALVVTGLLNKQVGGELGISEITVKAHRGRMMEKMQARSLAELVNISARLGLAQRAET